YAVPNALGCRAVQALDSRAIGVVGVFIEHAIHGIVSIASRLFFIFLLSKLYQAHWIFTFASNFNIYCAKLVKLSCICKVQRFRFFAFTNYQYFFISFPNSNPSANRASAMWPSSFYFILRAHLPPQIL